jgi:predicted GIY-YIG superfamily endonuclease
MPCKICKLVGHNSRTCQKSLKIEPKIDSEINNNDKDDVIILSPANDEITMTCREIDIPTKRYYCYILQQDNKINSLNYVGYTVNFNRRIRQHNCIIKGGARYTKNRGPWSFLAVMTCSSWNNIRAMQVEWLIKHPTRARKRQKCFSGSLGRTNSLVEIFKRIPSEEKIDIYIHPDFIENALNLTFPENIEIKQNLVDF